MSTDEINRLTSDCEIHDKYDGGIYVRFDEAHVSAQFKAEDLRKLLVELEKLRRAKVCSPSVSTPEEVAYFERIDP